MNFRFLVNNAAKKLPKSLWGATHSQFASQDSRGSDKSCHSPHAFKMTETKPMESAIRAKLSANLQPTTLDVINESYMHNVPPGSETHFKVVVVSPLFEGLPLLKRHRLVNDILREELKSGVHALSIIASTPDKQPVVEPSPKCLGGFGK